MHTYIVKSSNTLHRQTRIKTNRQTNKERKPIETANVKKSLTDIIITYKLEH